MPLPVAHGLLGVTVAMALRKPLASRPWKLVLIAAFLSICPDFDYGLNWFRISGGGWHHGFTHSILFAISVGLITPMVLGERQARSVILYSAVTVSHTLLDFMMTESRGVALWWPFTDHRYKLRLTNPIDYTWSSASFREAIFDLLSISLVEVVIFAPLLLVVLLVKKLFVERRVAA